MKLMNFTTDTEKNESINAFFALIGYIHCIAIVISAVIRIVAAITITLKRKGGQAPSSETGEPAVEETAA